MKDPVQQTYRNIALGGEAFIERVKEKDGFPLPVFTSTSFMGMIRREMRMALVKQDFTDQV